MKGQGLAGGGHDWAVRGEHRHSNSIFPSCEVLLIKAAQVRRAKCEWAGQHP